MENPLGVILLVVAGIAYKIYESFKEEQAKAKQRAEKLKKRMPKGSARDIVLTKPTRPVPTSRPPILEFPADDFPEFQTPTPTRQNSSSAAQTTIRNSASKERDVSLKKQSEIAARSQDHAKNDGTSVEFNLREAVIQQAILNRPYAD